MKHLILLLAAVALPLAAQLFFSPVSREQTHEQKLLFSQARPYEEGFQLGEPNEIVIDNIGRPKRRAGASWTVTLNQKVPMPFSVTAESLLENAIELNHDGYNLYLDIIYMDNTPLWGKRALFPISTIGEWQKRTITMSPDKPVKTVTVYLLFRDTGGKVRFREPTFTDVRIPQACLFDTVPVTIDSIPQEPTFIVRNITDQGDFVALSTLNNTFRPMFTTKQLTADAKLFELTLTSFEKRDCALTVIYAIPVPKGDVMWHESPRVSAAEPQNQCGSTSSCDAGCGAYSKWPFGAISVGGNFSKQPYSHDKARGLAIGRDPDTFALYRIAYHPQTRLLFIAFDLGFSPECPEVKLRFCVFDFQSENAFRGALAAYQKLFPEAHRRRLDKHGVWMPFHAIKDVQGFEDFGFKFMEDGKNPDWDDAHDILTFRYTEPATWWMKMKGDHYSFDDCLKEAERLAAAGDEAARAWKTSVFKNEKGDCIGQLLNRPWCKGIAWSINSAPNIPGDINDYKFKQSEADYQKRYAKAAPQGIDGEYIDSSELYVTEAMDFDRSHFAAMETPLCFAVGSHKVGIYKGAVAFEYVRDIARRLHALNRFTMANSTPDRCCWLAPHLDLLGTETNWNPDNHWRPMSHEAMMYRRAICGDKPYCFLQNTNFADFTYQMSEKFMMRSLAYGFFPGYFSADAATNTYFSQPQLYNRDRPLFKKYVPLCRLVSEAGWRPVNTLVYTSTPDILVEQFGDRYLTVFNDSDTLQMATLRTKGTVTACRELVEDISCEWQNGCCIIQIPPESVRLLEIKLKK